MSWRELERAAPDIAAPGRECLERVGIAMLGTVRKDGSPRISPVEAHVASGHLLFAAMPWSLKERDLVRDSRCVLHSAICNPDAGESELKLYGRAEEAQAEIRALGGDAWWASRPAELAHVFSLEIEQAALVSWDLERGEMTVLNWSRGSVVGETTRTYP